MSPVEPDAAAVPGDCFGLEVSEACRVLRGAPEVAADLRSALRLLRRLGVLEPDRVAVRALRHVPAGGLWRFARRRLARVAPPLPDALRARGGGLTFVATGAELLALGRRFRNCLSAEPVYLLAFAAGHLHFAVAEGENPVMMSLTVEADGKVHLHDAAVLGFGATCRWKRTAALLALDNAGIPVVDDVFPLLLLPPRIQATLEGLERLRRLDVPVGPSGRGGGRQVRGRSRGRRSGRG